MTIVQTEYKKSDFQFHLPFDAMLHYPDQSQNFNVFAIHDHRELAFPFNPSLTFSTNGACFGLGLNTGVRTRRRYLVTKIQFITRHKNLEILILFRLSFFPLSSETIGTGLEDSYRKRSFSSLFVSSCSESFSTTFADFLRRNKGEDKKQEKMIVLFCL